MIEITDKTKCCGCTACVNRCPKTCISMEVDIEGFAYPVVNMDKCIECGICEKVCPVLSESTDANPILVYAATANNETILQESSSGGIFTLLAEYIIKKNGIVFGASFNEKWEVEHSYTDNIDGISRFRGSKYTQSNMGESYIHAKKFLEEGKLVLFSGTPCQIKGLKLFLKKEYDNLTTVDFICHGVPSPKLWNKYLKETSNSLVKSPNILSYFSKFNISSESIKSVKFRDKKLGWKQFSFKLNISIENIRKEYEFSDIFTKNIFMKAFLSDICLRPSCHECCAKSGKSGSDIKIADFWGIDHLYPELYNNKGVSWVGVMTSKGVIAIEKIQKYGTYNECDFEKSIKHNKSYYYSVTPHKYRNHFFKKIDKYSVDKLVAKYCTRSFFQRITRKLKNNILHILKK